MRDRLNFELNTTFRCNQNCAYCNRLVGLIDMGESDLTLEDVERFKAGIRRSNIKIRRLKMCGGEPTLHPKLAELCESLLELRKEGKLLRILIATNGKQGQPPMPEGCDYSVSPLRMKRHIPCLVSPWDLGFRILLRGPCEVQMRCGRSFDRDGFTFCSLASQFGLILGIEVHSPDVVLHHDSRICKHCLRILPTHARLILAHAVMSGIVKYPTATLARGLEIEAKQLKLGGIQKYYLKNGLLRF